MGAAHPEISGGEEYMCKHLHAHTHGQRHANQSTNSTVMLACYHINTAQQQNSVKREKRKALILTRNLDL